MAPKHSNGNQTYKTQIKLKSCKLNNNQILNVKADLTHINIQQR